MESWLIPAAPVSVTEEIKKSRFITLLAHTDGVEAAKAFVAAVRAEHPDARHHCVAWVAGAPDDSQQLGFSDDGGVLLGTGGLVKAYGGGVHQALAALTTERKTPLIEYTLQCEYGQLAGVESLLAQFAGKIISSEYQAVVDLKVALPQAELAAFSTKLADFSRGSLQLRRIDE